MPCRHSSRVCGMASMSTAGECMANQHTMPRIASLSTAKTLQTFKLQVLRVFRWVAGSH